MEKLTLPHQTAFYRGKVRDVYTIDEKWIILYTSDRISAFDVILPETIPYKGQVLNQIAAYMLRACEDICPIWLLDVPAPQISAGLKCRPFKIEMVVRGNLTGHAWRIYSSGGRNLCGVSLPEGLKENDFFPTPIITPSTKADEGHDEDISREQIIAQGLASEKDYEKLEKYALRLFERGKKMAAEKGLILVDTKYEFGKIGEDIYLMDEIHTPDSSRYFYANGFNEKQKSGEKQKQLSKEFVREWLIANNFMGKSGQQVPQMTKEWVDEISRKYIELFEAVTGEKFAPASATEHDTKKILQLTAEKLHQRK